MKADFEDLRDMVRAAITVQPLYNRDDWKEEFPRRAKQVCEANGWTYEEYWKERQERYGR
jgi:hypothetical protein